MRHVRILAPLEHTHRHEIFRHAGRAASLESAFDRCFGTVVKTSAIPSPVGILISRLACSALWNCSVQRTIRFSVSSNARCSLITKLGVTDDVDEQDMPDLEYR